MIKQIAWNTFKNTGNIDTFLELKQVTEIEQNIKAEKNEIIESKRNSNSGKNGIRFLQNSYNINSKHTVKLRLQQKGQEGPKACLWLQLSFCALENIYFTKAVTRIV